MDYFFFFFFDVRTRYGEIFDADSTQVSVLLDMVCSASGLVKGEATVTAEQTRP
jgi:hypothetical protein